MTDFIGENLKGLRTQAGLTTREVANDLDLHHGTIPRWENGELVISDERISELAEYYGVTIEDLEYGIIR